jgi:hypothetical protein
MPLKGSADAKEEKFISLTVFLFVFSITNKKGKIEKLENVLNPPSYHADLAPSIYNSTGVERAKTMEQASTVVVWKDKDGTAFFTCYLR